MKYLFFGGVLLMLVACSKSPKCWGDDRNEGIITNSVLISCEPTLKQENYVITSKTQYEALFSDSLGLLMCSLPAINFEKETLLGIPAKGQCRTKIVREVKEDKKKNVYAYIIKVYSCGICKKLNYNYNWVTVPVLPEGYEVHFEVKEK